MRAVKAAAAAGAGVALLAGGLVALPASAQTYYVPVTQTLTLHGRGYGHGNGMSQYGAEGAARLGKGYREIVAKYYPGTQLGAMKGRVRVLLTGDTTSDVKVSPARGLSVRDRADGRSWTLPTRAAIRRWRILSNDRIQFYNGTAWHRWAVPKRTTLRGEGEFFAAEPITLWVPSGSGEVGRRYRGILRSAVPSPGSSDRDTVNVLPMDGYVRGVVPAEMPASWSPEALKAQAVAARTYATRDRMVNRARYYHTCDTTSCQVYGGVGSEHPSTNAAVRASARQILRYGGEPAFTQFSSSSGGWTGQGSQPYLKAQPDPWDDWAGNANHTWTVKVSAATLERRYTQLGRLQAVDVTSRNGFGRWGGRVLRLTLDGTRADVTMTGDDFRWAYGLRSSWFKIADTPIMQRWKRIGAARSVVGRPVSAERPARRGAVQRFRKGRIFWSSRTGPRETYGKILRTYLARGGTKSKLGYPRTGVKRAGADGHMVIYQHGRRLYLNPPTGVHEVKHGWLRAYRRAGWVRGGLGLPRTDVFRVRKGHRMRFEGGRITRTRDGRYHVRIRG